MSLLGSGKGLTEKPLLNQSAAGDGPEILLEDRRSLLHERGVWENRYCQDGWAGRDHFGTWT